jgi:hypothetical protein
MNSTLSLQSKRTYISVLKKIVKHTDQPLCYAINQPRKTITTLQNNAIKNDDVLMMAKAILALMKYSDMKTSHPDLYTKWHDEFKTFDASFKERMDRNLLSDKQKLAMVSWNDVMKHHTNLGKTKYASDEHLLFSMFCLIPPRRQVDYYRIRIYDKEVDHSTLLSDDADASGMIVLSGGEATITVVKGKTIDSYDIWKKKLPSTLTDIIVKSLQKQPRKYLFVKNNKPFQKVNTFTQYSNNILKTIFSNEAMSVNILRHSFASYVHNQPFSSVEELKQIAYDMGHSLIMNMTYVKKVKT